MLLQLAFLFLFFFLLRSVRDLSLCFDLPDNISIFGLGLFRTRGEPHCICTLSLTAISPPPHMMLTFGQGQFCLSVRTTDECRCPIPALLTFRYRNLLAVSSHFSTLSGDRRGHWLSLKIPGSCAMDGVSRSQAYLYVVDMQVPRHPHAWRWSCVVRVQAPRENCVVISSASGAASVAESGLTAYLDSLLIGSPCTAAPDRFKG